VGTGSPREAEFSLIDSVPAGTYRLIGDGIITGSVDVTWEVIWRRPGMPPTDVVLATWTHHFDPRGMGDFRAQAFEESMSVTQAIDFVDGDQLVLRYNGMNGPFPMSYVPNGDGALAEGRIPNLTLPP
jgi:hypothetical protein